MTTTTTAQCRLMPDWIFDADVPRPGIFFNSLISVLNQGLPESTDVRLRCSQTLSANVNGRPVEIGPDSNETYTTNFAGQLLVSVDAIATPLPPALLVHVESSMKSNEQLVVEQVCPLVGFLKKLGTCSTNGLQELIAKAPGASNAPLAPAVTAALQALGQHGAAAMQPNLFPGSWKAWNPDTGIMRVQETTEATVTDAKDTLSSATPTEVLQACDVFWNCGHTKKQLSCRIRRCVDESAKIIPFEEAI